MKNSVNDNTRIVLDRAFKALGDPHRVMILKLLREKELSAGELLESIDIVQSTLSHHMKSLVDAGVVCAKRQGKWAYYSLNQENLALLADFLGDCAEGTKMMTKTQRSGDEAIESAAESVSLLEEMPEEPGKPEGPEKTDLSPSEPVQTEKNAYRVSTEKAGSKKEVIGQPSEGKSEKKKSKKSKKGKKNKK